ncbi:uncharacterized protein LOC109793905 [Cajanus cajan]|uniref:Uncharacterized protein n=1 Tax=Cajanus cajan TaxID=3821 RepID=A0A151UGR6_CAJCA|nr:uncharacterized protein LOC109793905 [Cajanus cajan]
MYLLIVFLPLIGSSFAGFFGRFLGSEGSAIMTTSVNLVLFAIMILGFLFLFRLYGIRLRKKYGLKCFLFVYISVIFCIYSLFYFFRVYLVSNFSSCAAFSGLLIMYASDGGILPSSGASSSESCVNQVPGGNDAGPSNVGPSNVEPAANPAEERESSTFSEASVNQQPVIPELEPTISNWIEDVDLPQESPSDTINDLRDKCAIILESFSKSQSRDPLTWKDIAQRLALEGKETTAEVGATREDFQRLLGELNNPGESDVYLRVLKALEQHPR